MPNAVFDNVFLRELPGDPLQARGVRQVHGALWSMVAPTAVPAPRLLAFSREVAAMLGLEDDFVASQQFADVFGGNALLEGMQTHASNYGGHQFGHWAGQLGDGRAIGLGSLVAPSGDSWELQLKGAGPTPYSRSADGRAVLRSSIREFLCSEAMHHLGVPTTRALSLVSTGESVVRDMFYDGRPEQEPGAIVCRVAPTFLRLGHFELPASRGENEILETLVEFTIRNYFPHIRGRGEERILEWFGEVCERTASMVAHWMRVGFVHGVMNTDNLSILGLTIDYGPYGWIDAFDPDWTPNTTDSERRRYRFGNQPQVAGWNLGRLAAALTPLLRDSTPLHAGLQRFVDEFASRTREDSAAKLGLGRELDASLELMRELGPLLQEGEVDMTLFFRLLPEVDSACPDLESLEPSFYNASRKRVVEERLLQWLRRLSARVIGQSVPPAQRRAAMNRVNPKFVLRNYLAQEAIDAASQGDASGVSDLLDVMRQPYADQPGREHFAMRRPDWARNRAGCSMLSCSS